MVGTEKRNLINFFLRFIKATERHQIFQMPIAIVPVAVAPVPYLAFWRAI